MTIGITGAITAAAVMHFGSARQGVKADTVMRVVRTQLNSARDFSISEGRNVQLQFPAQNVLQIARRDVPGGSTVIGAVLFESGAEYVIMPGLPDTPDGFGHTKAVDFGSATTVMFTSNGAFIDQTGNRVNGTIFVGLPGQPLSARAITIHGATGRVRAYRWTGMKWSVRDASG